MAILFEGDCNGKAVDVEAGVNPKTKKPEVKWNMLVVDGPHAGKKASYKGKLDADNIKWTKMAMIAIGWQGKDISTFVEDVKKAGKTIPFTAEIARHTYEDSGKTSEWTSAKNIGFQSRPLEQLDKDKLADVNSWFAEVGDVTPSDGGSDKDLPF